MEKTKENEFLQLALEALRNNLRGQAEIKTVNPVRDPRVRADYLLRIAAACPMPPARIQDR